MNTILTVLELPSSNDEKVVTTHPIINEYKLCYGQIQSQLQSQLASFQLSVMETLRCFPPPSTTTPSSTNQLSFGSIPPISIPWLGLASPTRHHHFQISSPPPPQPLHPTPASQKHSHLFYNHHHQWPNSLQHHYSPSLNHSFLHPHFPALLSFQFFQRHTRIQHSLFSSYCSFSIVLVALWAKQGK